MLLLRLCSDGSAKDGLLLWRGQKRIDASPRWNSYTLFRAYARLFLPLRRVIAYCRVSSQARKPALDNQRVALEHFCAARGFVDLEVIQEIGSGLNLTRKKFVTLMHAVERREVKVLVIAHQDRLVRFGFPWFAQFCADHGCELLVLNHETLSPEQEMVQDLMTIVQCFSSRLYGLRNSRKTLSAALKDPAP